jgi:hypothetical protein
MDEQRILEELILDDLKEWVEHYLLDSKDMYTHLDEVEEDQGKEARSKELSNLMHIYFRDHILPISED